MDASQIARRFPLVARPRPACLPLAERVEEIADLARSARRDGKLTSAAVAQNKAALIASDCGMPELARALCWRHTEVYLCAQPLGAQEARYALEPLVNLARLLIRDGDGDGAYQLLDTLNRAARSRGEAVIDGRVLSFRNLTSSDDDHRQLCQWLWTTLLGDGTRALVAAGRWDRARAHAQRHRGVGNRLFDGRQVEALARCLGGEPASALEFLKRSTLSEGWERAVASCLGALCLAISGNPDSASVAAMVRDYLSLDCARELAVFRTRVGLTVVDLSNRDAAAEVYDRIVDEAATFGDGYVAREVLACARYREQLSSAERRGLSAVVVSAGLGQGHMPRNLEQDLLSAVGMSAAATERALATTSLR
ncbi:hypothetical protein SSP35_20_00990 [Streptomyces sp. NBRC 110611]|uniref:hypothetical protein n=1 Tax=Streptomyces sp. NBRC 110611 TaxID=1621259 RepID=UPI000857FB5C|nr:hypothetical protein [Streptomyces sp. NBRC 110611]GAU70603.1 hypothetical protein SSP35_20_00990 [Streptomyces sp. NBRC 110611]